MKCTNDEVRKPHDICDRIGSRPQDTFTSIPVQSTRFAKTASKQYYSYLPSLAHASKYLSQKICQPSDQQCLNTAAALSDAQSLDVDFDAISSTVIISAYWNKHMDDGPWTETIKQEELKSDRIEVAILNAEEASSSEDIKLGGWLTVVGEDTKPSEPS